MIYERILNWLVPFLCGGCISVITAVIIMWKALRDGVCCLLRAEIIRQYEKWVKRKCCPIYAKEALQRAYKAYHALHGNDVATDLVNETLELPPDPPERNK